MPRDTDPEIARVQYEAWRAKTPQERAAWWFERIHLMNLHRFEMLRLRHPGASEAEITALWMEETYRHSLPPELLARACVAIRASGDSLRGAPARGPRRPPSS